MQKKIIALAVAGLVSGAAFAQSNVTMYGVVDMYYAYSDADGREAQHSINSGGLSGSRLGFKGTEDLGNGLKGVFVLEYGLTADDNTGVGSGAVARQQYLGVAGGFGTVVAGRLQTAGYDFACASGPAAGSAIDPYNKIGATFLLNCNQGGRANNAFAYISPNFSGFTVAYNHGRVTEAANTNVTGNDAYANLLTGTYSNGPIAANLTWSQVQMENTVASDDITEWGINGSYDFGMFKLYGSYQDQDTDNNPALSGNKWTLAGSIKVGGAGAVHLQYADSSIDAANSDSYGWMLAYTHSLSKRTTAYAGYTWVSNDSAVSRAAGFVAPVAGGDSNVIAAGVRHTF